MSDGIVMPTRANFKNLTGQRFGRWMVMSYVGRHHEQDVALWKALCDCGTERTVRASGLLSGTSTSCGCERVRKAVERVYTHGMTKTRLYRIWVNMRERCSNPSVPNYCSYGGRGISVCDDWRASFESFRDWAVDNGYQDGLSIDRYPNQDGNYEPSNCRWSTPAEQNRNKRDTILITAFGESKVAVDWEADPRSAARAATIRLRVKNGWGHEEAITTPSKNPNRDWSPISAFGESKSMADWSRDPRCVVSYNILRIRLRAGVQPEVAITTQWRRGQSWKPRRRATK